MNKIKSYFSNYKLHNWIGLIGLLLYTVSVGFLISNFVEYATKVGQSWKIFFGIFDRFTWQSNMLLFAYMLLYILKPNHSIFKGNKFLILTMTYIFFTFFGYNVVLILISHDRGYSGDALSIIKNLWVHAICPLWFIFYGYTFMLSNKDQQPDSIIKTIIFGMIYPIIYAIYLITIPYIFSDYRHMPDFYKGNGLAYSVYGKATNTYNFGISYAYILIMLLVFFPGSMCLFHYSWKGLNKINIKRPSKLF